MTTEGMPEHVKAWLMERLEGMKVIHRHGQDQRDLDYSMGSNDAIDAVIALVREG